MKRFSLALVLSLALVFLSGVVVGAIGYRLLRTDTIAAKTERLSPEEYRRRYVETMRTRLALSEAQVAELNKILDRTKERFRALEDEWKGRKHSIIAHQVEEIKGILNEGQQIEYAKLREERAERRRQRKARENEQKRSGSRK